MPFDSTVSKGWRNSSINMIKRKSTGTLDWLAGRQVDNTFSAVQINDMPHVHWKLKKAYHMFMLPNKAISEDSFFSLGV